MGARIASIVVVSLAAFAARGEGARCAESAAQWQPGRGEFAADLGCGAYFLTTDAEDHDDTLGEVSWREPVRLPYQASLRVRRLGPEGGRTWWLKILGAHLLFKGGAVALWVNRAQFAAAGGYRRVAAFAAHDEHAIVVRQTFNAVEVRIDGGPAIVLPHEGQRGPGKLAIGFNGARGHRSRLQLSGFAVQPLQQK